MANPRSRQNKTVNEEHQKIEEWVDRYTEILYLYAVMRVSRPELAEDLVQETFLAAIQGWQNFSGRSSEKTWLIGILRHKISDHFRKIGVRTEKEDKAWQTEYFNRHQTWKDKMLNWNEDPESLAENGEFWRVLLKCLKGLSTAMSQVFVLRELEGINADEICNRLEISETNLWVRLHRARLQLRRCLQVNWFD